MNALYGEPRLSVRPSVTQYKQINIYRIFMTFLKEFCLFKLSTKLVRENRRRD